MQSINAILRYGEAFLKEFTPDYLIDAKLLLEHTIGKDSIYLFMNKDELLEEDLIATYKGFLERRKTGEPLQYIVGHQSFMGLEFLVRPGVLIPRSDTEVLVEKVIEAMDVPSPRLLDIGTGSGAIHIALASYIKEASCVTVDISKEAIAIAKENARRLDVYD
ncbi:HemK/PrmC family methyltransferase, partial [Sphaerochaeta sp. S2]|uniref:N5-glutamine methyltransferase family protein n=1 Tax=Sphaerochaeta sp. S2 TaxID=2798868 RepID=UPI0018E927AA